MIMSKNQEDQFIITEGRNPSLIDFLKKGGINPSLSTIEKIRPSPPPPPPDPPSTKK